MSGNRLALYMDMEWKFINLKPAFTGAVGTLSQTLLVYSDMALSNMVGHTKQPLVREVMYKWDGSGSVYFGPCMRSGWPHVACTFT